MSSLDIRTPFDKWFYAQQDPTVFLDGRPVPMATTLLYKHCANNATAFDAVVALLEQAFAAGAASAANKEHTQ